MTEQRSREDIDHLKANWRTDPIWDIEDTDGFEAHREELAAYRAECEAEWDRKREERLTAKAEEIGCPGNLTLAAYVDGLEARIAKLSKQIDGVAFSLAD